MKPLYAVAFGLVLIALGPADPEPGVFDPLPDPLGWLFVMIGLHGAAEALAGPRLEVLRFLGATALVASAALVVPAADRWVATDPSLGWAADVPRFAFFALLSYEISAAAVRHRATLAAVGFNLSALALLFVLVAPPIAFGGGVDPVGTAGEAVAQAVQIVLVVLFLGYGNRPWAGAPAPLDPDDPEDPGPPTP